ncbi:MAG: NlpC/P60 family protein [Phycisphaerales bacterium]|nr:NlpC/P60 family protein [Phycisphaerales bacterium]
MLSKDHSTATKKNNNDSAHVTAGVFIDDINTDEDNIYKEQSTVVAPVSFKTKKGGADKKKNSRSNQQTDVAGDIPVIEENNDNNKQKKVQSSTFHATNPQMLKLKYSIILNTSEDKLNSDVALLADIDKWWGTKYCWGGSSPTCIDCSALTKTLMQDVYGVSIPRNAYEQYKASKKIKERNLRTGDLVFFATQGNNRKKITHVGMYIINNKFVNATTSSGVVINDLDEPYWKARYVSATRVLEK